jgi:hypothetical protein
MYVQHLDIRDNATAQLIDTQNIYKSLPISFQDYINKRRDYLYEDIARPINKNPFYYRSEYINFEGRIDELDILRDFLADNHIIRITPVMGCGGSGKSRLVYEFAKECVEAGDWAVAYLDSWSDFADKGLHKALDYSFSSNLLLIMDYVLANANAIGEWVRHLREYSSTINYKLRIIILEREVYSPEREDNPPLWYDQMIIKNKLKDTLSPRQVVLDKMDNKLLIKIALNYIVQKEKKRYSDEVVFEAIIQPLIKTLDREHVRPIFVLYTADAWINNKNLYSRNARKQRIRATI